MLPSLLARDIRTGLKQYLVTAYDPSDEFFNGLVARFVENESAWVKGPFVQVGLPFRSGRAGRDFFRIFRTDNPAYTHQEKSWERLTGGGAANTVVATGTGSGKTECFLFPILDHCARALAATERGIKALVIYPRFYALGWWLPSLGRFIGERFVPEATGAETPLMGGDLER